jgi:hypothetical protein
MLGNISKWIKKNKNEFYVLLFILSLGAFLRLYKISGYMTFLGDEGRDAIIVRRLLVYFDPILIGPGTSIGNMYLGPLYYYLSAPFLLLANFSPVGPSIMVALLGVATIFMVWYMAKIWFGNKAAVISSLLYALSPVVIIYSRSSWNPNIMPFFALLTIFSLWKVWSDGNYRWLSVTGISFAFVLQSHYLGLLLLPTILLFIILKFIKFIRTGNRNNNLIIQQFNSERNTFTKNLIFGILIFAILMSPLLIFDLRHNWMNFNAIKTFFTQRETTVSIKPWKSLPNIYPIIRDGIATRIVAGTNVYVGNLSSNIIIITFITYIIFNFFKLKSSLNTGESKDVFNKGFFLLVVWLIIGLIGMGLYKQHVYDHYFGFLFPAFFLFVGGIYQKIYNLHFDGLKIIITAWVILLIGSYIVNSPIRGVPNYQMYRAREVAKFIKTDIGNSKFNLAVIAVQNYEDGYQYFLEKDGANVADIDAQRLEETVGEYLYVICEVQEEKCDPTHSPKAEVANFGWSKIENKWRIAGVLVYKLAHSK